MVALDAPGIDHELPPFRTGLDRDQHRIGHDPVASVTGTGLADAATPTGGDEHLLAVGGELEAAPGTGGLLLGIAVAHVEDLDASVATVAHVHEVVAVVDPQVAEATGCDRQLHAASLEPLEVDLEGLGVVTIVGIPGIVALDVVVGATTGHPGAGDLRGGAAIARRAGATDGVPVEGQLDRDRRSVLDVAVEPERHRLLVEGAREVHREHRGGEASGNGAVVAELQ